MSDESTQRPRVGVSLLVVKQNCILLARRKGSHGAGEYAGPGGHLELGETFEGCAIRELGEECGPKLLVTPPAFLRLMNLRAYLPKHYADVGLVSYWLSGEPETMEPDKSEPWAWHDLDRLPDQGSLFAGLSSLVDAYRYDHVYFN